MKNTSNEGSSITIENKSRSERRSFTLKALSRATSNVYLKSTTLAPEQLEKLATVKEKSITTTLSNSLYDPFQLESTSRKTGLTSRLENLKEKLEGDVSMRNLDDKAMVIAILKKGSTARNAEEIAFLQKAFNKVKFFEGARKDLEDNNYNHLFENLKLEGFKAGHRLFNIGDHGKKFYIIIQGSVYVLLRKRGILKDTEHKEEYMGNANMVDKNDLKTFRQDGITEKMRLKILERLYPGLWVANTLHAGQSFGDIALQITGDRKRVATIICSENTIFGVLSFDDYQASLGRVYQKKFAERIDFISRINLFHHWKSNQICTLLFHIEEVVQHRHQVVFKEGDESDKIYFVMQGEVELWKKVSIEGKARSTSNLLSSNFALQQKAKRKKDIKIGLISSGEYFGASGMLHNALRDYSAICSSSDVRLMSLTRERFNALIKDGTTLKALESHIEQKEIWRNTMTSNYLSIASKLDNINSPTKTEPDQMSPLFPEVSTKIWRDEDGSMSNAILLNRKLGRAHKSTTSLRITPCDQISTTDEFISKVSTGYPKSRDKTPVAIHNNGSPLNLKRISMTPLNKRSRSRGAEGLQVLSIDKRSPTKMKGRELDFAHMRVKANLQQNFQREHEKMLREERDRVQRIIDLEDSEDFNLNFIKNGVSFQKNEAVGLVAEFNLDAISSNQSFGNNNSNLDHERMDRFKGDPQSPTTKLTISPKNDIPRIKLMRRIGVERLYSKHSPVYPGSVLHNPSSMGNESLEVEPSSTFSPNLKLSTEFQTSPKIKINVSPEASKSPAHKKMVFVGKSLGLWLQKDKGAEIPRNSYTSHLAEKISSKVVFKKIQKVTDMK